MGVLFPDWETLDSTANAVGTNIFEEFEPTSKSITLDIRQRFIQSNRHFLAFVKWVGE
ncbi:MAG: hypothetical protein LBT46_04995 [Planctomycetaceae bacterium]|jgi:hypothetical protein|nr:hypothetical protein [Planctomycetaceae bacterium]